MGSAGILTSAQTAALSVELDGLKGVLQENVEAHLEILTRSKGEGAPASAAEVKRLHRGAAQEIREALQPYGYYDPVINGSLERVDEEWQASYDIDPGPATRLGKVHLQLDGEGRDHAALRKLIADAGLNTGQVLRHEKYSSLKSSLLNTAYALGFLDGKYQRSLLEVHPAQQTADITLVFDTGPRYYFGEVAIEQDILNPEFVNKFIDDYTGEPFETQRLIELQLALGDSGYFRQVELDVEREQTANVAASGEVAADGAQPQIPVTVRTEPTKARRYEASAGFSTDTGPRLGLGALIRRINRAGHQLRADLRLSPVQSTLVTQYKIPTGDVRSEFFDITADVEKRSLNDVDVTQYSVGGGLNQNRWGGRRRLSLALEHESWAFGDGPQQTSTLLVPTLHYTYKKADDLLFTRQGYSVGVSLLGAIEEVAFGQLELNARGVLPLGEAGRFLVRGEYGATATDDFNQLPPSKRFFTGGAQSVRGYDFEDLSPRNSAGDLIGGQYLASASVEVDYLFTETLGLAVFIDAGNATDKPFDNLKLGAGLGFRYRTPVGMLRVDFAHPLDDPSTDFRFHISIGPDLQ